MLLNIYAHLCSVTIVTSLIAYDVIGVHILFLAKNRCNIFVPVWSHLFFTLTYLLNFLNYSSVNGRSVVLFFVNSFKHHKLFSIFQMCELCL